MQTLASALQSQVDILPSLVSGLRTRSSEQVEMASGRIQLRGRSSANRPRGQSPATALVDRGGRSRNQGESGGGHNAQRRLYINWLHCR